MKNNLCYCGSNTLFSECCEPFITNNVLPHSAEQLMRSRFTAFCLHKCQYLISTHHPNKRHKNDLAELDASCRQTKWIKLIIQQTNRGQIHDKVGVVKFSAIFLENNQFFELSEESSFVKESNQWFYVDGKPYIQKINYKIRRNETCWCFSGKKFKHCHAVL